MHLLGVIVSAGEPWKGMILRKLTDEEVILMLSKEPFGALVLVLLIHYLSQTAEAMKQSLVK